MLSRKPAVAGAFYPAESAKLRIDIDEYLNQVKNNPNYKTLRTFFDNRQIKAIIVPHAGYIYSAPIAGFAYSLIEGKSFSRIVLIGPSHTYPVKNAAIPESRIWETPLGNLDIDPNIDILTNLYIEELEIAHLKEHCLEVQLPFLQNVLKSKFTIIPVLIGSAVPRNIYEKIISIIDDNTLIVISSDLSHYLPYEEAKKRDKKTIDAILSLNSEIILDRSEACGIAPIAILALIAKKKKWDIKLLDYRNSGDTAGDRNAVVGYSSFAVFA